MWPYFTGVAQNSPRTEYVYDNLNSTGLLLATGEGVSLISTNELDRDQSQDTTRV